MKILMLNYEFPPIGGGAANAHLALLKEYAKFDDLKIDVLTSAQKPGFFEENFSKNIAIYKVGIHKKELHYWRKKEVLEWLLKAKRHYRKMLGENNYDLAHAFFGFPTGWLCYRTAKQLPYIISLRGSDVPGKHARLKLDYKVLAPVFKSIWKKAAAIVACSEGLKKRALKFFPLVSIDVIPNGVDTERFYPAENKQPDDMLKLLTVGRLSVTKRIDMLIDAVEISKKEGRNIHFRIIGGGSLEDKLRELVRKKQLTNTIEFTGRVEPQKMPELYRQSDIFISATMQEGMSNAMLEAMASGLPIITTNCEGAEELINDNGIIVEQQTAEAIAEAIKNLADNKKAFDTMRITARQQAEKFSWKKTAEDYVKLYEQIIRKKL